MTFGPLKGRMHPAGWPFVLSLGALALGLFILVLPALGTVFVFCTLGCAAFFREPVRVPPTDSDAFLSPADGILTKIEKAKAPQEVGPYAEGEWIRLSVFLSIFDVHVVRMPQSGRVLMTKYHQGQFLSATQDKASHKNERNSVVLEWKSTNVIVTKIAGLIARRIVCDVSIGDEVKRGDTFGIIRFGSRVDLYLPSDTVIHVREGQRMVGGETVMAHLTS